MAVQIALLRADAIKNNTIRSGSKGIGREEKNLYRLSKEDSNYK